jgi:hypothetical protein
MAQCCIGAYYAIVPYHLVLLCSGTYLLVMHCTILAISTFLFGTQYNWICTLNCAVQIQMYWVSNWNVEIARIVRCITRRYVQVYTATEKYKVVWYYSIVCTNIALCQLRMYFLVLGIPKLYKYVLPAGWCWTSGAGPAAPPAPAMTSLVLTSTWISRKLILAQQETDLESSVWLLNTPC